ncbi:YqcC family protein [Permianibacter sp. IMCC34836]|uniref:YqcC family protein n=1 Tax=Permianibacter fluminis TaxID=2738515 RepID=UPI001554B768|nr:YqcC family protein [Permianibacter fluminis]NQD37110.1 YqcC family protein [Permianibacter fluminis]
MSASDGDNPVSLHPEVQLQECTRLLGAIQQELRRLDCWAAVPPPVERFASTLPFCVDTLSIEQWLQFVFLPRMQALLDAGAELPRGSGLAAYAEVCFRDQMAARRELITLLKAMDELLVAPVVH